MDLGARAIDRAGRHALRNTRDDFRSARGAVMTVLQLISSEGYYGAESMLVALAESQMRSGHRTVIAVFNDTRHPHTEVAERAAMHGMETRLIHCSGRFDRGSIRQIRALLGEVNPD